MVDGERAETHRGRWHRRLLASAGKQPHVE